MRLIDADTVITIQVYDDMTETISMKKMTIADAIDEWSDEGCPPTVDTVEVVRCKNCTHKYYDGNQIICQKMYYCDGNNFEPSAEDFCSRG